MREHWLDNLSEQEVLTLANHSHEPDLVAHPIARELFNQNISYKSMLEPVSYRNIPLTQL